MHSLLRRVRGFSFSLTIVAALVVGAALLPPQGASADPIVGSIVLNPEDISNFTLVGTQAPATGPQLLFADASAVDVSGLYAAVPWAAAGTTVDLIATFQVTSQAAHGVDAGFQLVINDGANNWAAIASAILINNLPHIGLVGTGPRDQLATYPAFIQAEWQAAPLTIHLRRWANGSFEVLELNGAPPSQPVFLSASQLAPGTRAFGSVDFGAFSPQAIVNASVSEFRAFTVPEPDTTPDPQEMTEDLIGVVSSLGLPQGIQNSLISKLSNVIKSLEKGQTNGAINQLNAFINEVQAQSGKKLTSEQANMLILEATKIIERCQAI